VSERRALRRPPRLVVKTLAVTFVTVFVLLAVVFIVVTVTVRRQVRESVAASLESSQRMFAALETRRQLELVAQASTVADNPTLKAALDTYQAEARTSTADVKDQLLATIDSELKKVAARVEADAIVLVDMRQNTLAAAGRMGDRWPRGRPAMVSTAKDASSVDGIARSGDVTFRVAAVPLEYGDGTRVGTLYLATKLDASYAQALAQLAGTRIAIVSDGLMLATTLPAAAARQFEAIVVGAKPIADTVTLDG